MDALRVKTLGLQHLKVYFFIFSQMVVYVLDINGNPLMPTSRNRKVRKMLEKGLCHIVKTTPFTIQLDYDTTNVKQDITLGIDCGTKHIGVSATTNKKELFSAEVILRTDIVELISTRRETRRTRRARLRHRKARFDNRVSRKHKGWLAPSIENKINSHLSIIRKLHSILPITRVNLEVGSFDTQKMQDDSVQSIGYQQGVQYGFWNVREYVLARDKHTCQCCKGKSKDKILNTHHIESRKIGGNSPNNLITLCETCHDNYHKGLLPKFQPKRGKSLRDSAVMSIFKWRLYELAKQEFSNVGITFGYITKCNRIHYGLSKSHNTDAFCIACHFLAERLCYMYKFRQLRKHNRQIHKFTINKGGVRKLNQTPHKVFGYRLFDEVMWNGKKCFIGGRRSSGSFKLVNIDNKVIKDGVLYKKLKLVEPKRTFIGLIVK